MKSIFLLYKNGFFSELLATDDLYNELKIQYKDNNYVESEKAYIFFSLTEYLNALQAAEDHKLF